MDFPLWLAAVFVFILAVIVYVALMIFLPEWVGITGKKALESQKAHLGDPAPSEKSDSKSE
jgi:hypothetical protein